jgi:hypothetical protein
MLYLTLRRAEGPSRRVPSDFSAACYTGCRHVRQNRLESGAPRPLPPASGSGERQQVGDLDGEHANISRQLHSFAHAISNVLLEVEMPHDRFARMARAFIAAKC